MSDNLMGFQVNELIEGSVERECMDVCDLKRARARAS